MIWTGWWRFVVVGFLGVSGSVGYGLVSASAYADGDPATDDVRTGNGSRNHTISSMKSPTSNRGYQHTSTSTAGGMTDVHNALCRYVFICTINQKLVIK